jgi:hypothetical protein
VGESMWKSTICGREKLQLLTLSMIMWTRGEMTRLPEVIRA